MHLRIFKTSILMIATSYYQVQAQNTDPVKKLSYDQVETVSFAISSGLDLESLHPSDILMARNEVTKTSKIINVERSGKLRTESISLYSNGQEKSQFTRPYRTVLDEQGVSFYTAENVLYFQEQHTEDYEIPTFELTEDFITHFGYHPILERPNQEELNSLINSGMAIDFDGQNTLTLIDSNVRAVFDFINQYTLEEFYRNGVLHHSIFTKFSPKLENGMAVIVLTIEKSYLTLKNGGLMEKTIQTVFNNYKIDNQAVYQTDPFNEMNNRSSDLQSSLAINQFDSKLLSKQESVVLWPNPSTDIINIEIKEPSGELKYRVLNLQGQTVATGNFQRKVQISLSDISNGSYILEIINGDIYHFKKFQKI
ncbi:MAG: T9SS type A sorting domain-containing protein [Saprospiraceae bacterium]|nr:T9SS type A sorting domain-containing protein [Saprospiraceae bacterium]MBK9629895.1 T9SS type A sorting domain-containing protein [Saprospiraceae bacterium]